MQMANVKIQDLTPQLSKPFLTDYGKIDKN